MLVLCSVFLYLYGPIFISAFSKFEFLLIFGAGCIFTWLYVIYVLLLKFPARCNIHLPFVSWLQITFRSVHIIFFPLLHFPCSISSIFPSSFILIFLKYFPHTDLYICRICYRCQHNGNSPILFF